ncbi:hypothetical protein pEaSNUABM8_00150 [Erwinia phage pEa_SNUABM_8]|nr:hypothetical protein pEaSNUABM8_00150 [Erwinia phage pEa_SNUABM_8]QVW54902.1 hypothetical protein pEaSNUABM4_00149 [Erwinia phage pEa_SNUABM_4]
MQMSFFTKRERAFLSKCTTIGLNIKRTAADEQLTIEPIKAYIASNFPEKEWDDVYRLAFTVHHALITLAEYNTCKRLDGWTWFVPRTPDHFHMAGVTEPVFVKPIAHPERLDESLEMLWDRPRQELMKAVNILRESGKFPDVQMQTPDRKSMYWRLSWYAGEFHNRNVIYLNRR